MKGIIVPLVTPINNKEIDLSSLKRLIDYVIKGSVDGIFILGTTGEFLSLSPEQKKILISKTTEFVNKRVPVMVGISSTDEKEFFDLLEFSQKMKADAVVAAFLHPERKEQLLEKIVNKTDLPFLLYNNPSIQQGENLDFGFLEKAAKLKNIVGIKDSSGNWDYFQKLLTIKSDNFDICYGRTEKLIDALNDHSDSIVNGYANVAPELLKKLYHTKSAELYIDLINLKNELNKLSNNQTEAMKLKLKKLGILSSAEMA